MTDMNGCPGEGVKGSDRRDLRGRLARRFGGGEADMVGELWANYGNKRASG